MTSEADWIGPSIVLIELDADVLVPMRTLTALVSYALAGPSNEATRNRRDEAVEASHRAVVAAYKRHVEGTR